ncbi:MAG: hypothetical protein Q9219_007666 [cf. Caloplaca sp. 3 TL-2023]
MMQWSSRVMPSKLYFIGWHFRIVAKVTTIQYARTTEPITRDWSLKDSSMAKIRRYRSKMDNFMAVTSEK